jgi:hypothetical protein
MLTKGSSGETDVSEGSDSGTVELRESAEPIDSDAMRFGGGLGAKTLPRASRCCATDLQDDAIVKNDDLFHISIHLSMVALIAGLNPTPHDTS